jgi:hypothetical protein
MNFNCILLKFKKHVGFEPSSKFYFVPMGVGNFGDKLNKLIDFHIGWLFFFFFLRTFLSIWVKDSYLLHCNQFKLLNYIKHPCIKGGRIWLFLFELSHWSLQNYNPPISLLVPLESFQWIGTHQGSFIMFRPRRWKSYWMLNVKFIIENSIYSKFKILVKLWHILGNVGKLSMKLHGGDFVVFRHKVWKTLNSKFFSHWRFDEVQTLEFNEIWISNFI